MGGGVVISGYGQGGSPRIFGGILRHCVGDCAAACKTASGGDGKPTRNRRYTPLAVTPGGCHAYAAVAPFRRKAHA